MNLIEVNVGTCNRCGLCIQVCPAQRLALERNTVRETPSRECIVCGHCVAVCPSGAFSHRLMSTEQCIEIDRALLPPPRAVEHFLKARRSSRVFKDEMLDKGILEKLVDIARYAPSGHNVQPVCWIIVSGREKIKVLGGLVVEWMRSAVRENPALDGMMKLSAVADSWAVGVDVITRGAPHIVVAHAPRLYGPLGYEGCLIALSYLELAAHSLGAGACWAGYFEMAAVNYPPLRQALNLPEGNRPYGAMILGWPRYEYSRIPLRKEPDVQWV